MLQRKVIKISDDAAKTIKWAMMLQRKIIKISDDAAKTLKMSNDATKKWATTSPEVMNMQQDT